MEFFPMNSPPIVAGRPQERGIPRRRIRFLRPAIATSLALVTAATIALAAEAIVVSQRNRMFSPARLEVERGTAIQITNDDRVTHHIYVDSPAMTFDSGEQPVGTVVKLQFDQPGTFDVLCAIHPTMRLQVTVK